MANTGPISWEIALPLLLLNESEFDNYFMSNEQIEFIPLMKALKSLQSEASGKKRSKKRIKLAVTRVPASENGLETRSEDGQDPGTMTPLSTCTSYIYFEDIVTEVDVVDGVGDGESKGGIVLVNCEFQALTENVNVSDKAVSIVGSPAIFEELVLNAINAELDKIKREEVEEVKDLEPAGSTRSTRSGDDEEVAESANAKSEEPIADIDTRDFEAFESSMTLSSLCNKDKHINDVRLMIVGVKSKQKASKPGIDLKYVIEGTIWRIRIFKATIIRVKKEREIIISAPNNEEENTLESSSGLSDLEVSDFGEGKIFEKETAEECRPGLEIEDGCIKFRVTLWEDVRLLYQKIKFVKNILEEGGFTFEGF